VPADTSINDESLNVVRQVVSAFTRLQIPYAVGGSIASTVLGRPRLTLDADISVEPFGGKETQLISALGADYYVSAPAIAEALARHASFNIVHTRTGFKIDVFVKKDRPFDDSLMARRAPATLSDAPEQPLFFVSAEDIILVKLEWYRLGGEISDRQWQDVLGVLKVQAGRLDETYLNYWAADLKVSDLLTRAQAEART
jgi:hypothetical protein